MESVQLLGNHGGLLASSLTWSLFTSSGRKCIKSKFVMLRLMNSFSTDRRVVWCEELVPIFFRETKLIIMSVMSTVRGLVHWGYFTPRMVTATTSCNYNHTLPVIWQIRLFINLQHWFALINYNWIDYYRSNISVWANWSDFQPLCLCLWSVTCLCFCFLPVHLGWKGENLEDKKRRCLERWVSCTRGSA